MIMGNRLNSLTMNGITYDSFGEESGLKYHGTNPITEDTTENWGALGNGFVYVTADDKVITRPITEIGTSPSYGFVIIHVVGNLVDLEWHSLDKAQRVYYRSGNSKGWYNDGEWILGFNERTYIPTINGGIGTDASVEIGVTEHINCCDRFVDEMNKMANSIGMVNSYFKTPSGLCRESINSDSANYNTIFNSYITAYDALRLLIAARHTPTVLSAMSTPKFFYRKNNGRYSVLHSILGSSSWQEWAAENGYTIIGAKGGSLSGAYGEIGDNGILNMAILVQDSESNIYGVTVIGLQNTADESALLKTLIADLINTVNGSNATDNIINASARTTYPVCMAAAKLTSDGSFEDDIKALSNGKFYNENEVRVAASIAKILNAIVCAGQFDNHYCTVTTNDLVGGSGLTLEIGDKFTTYDALHIMMLLSDNTMATLLARDFGKRLSYNSYASDAWENKPEDDYVSGTLEIIASYFARNANSDCVVGESNVDKVAYVYNNNKTWAALFNRNSYVNGFVTTDTIDELPVAYLDCSTFLTMVTKGYKFDDGPYGYMLFQGGEFSADPDSSLVRKCMENSAINTRWTFDFLNSIGTSDMAELMDSAGCPLRQVSRIVDDNITIALPVASALQTGDIVFRGRSSYEVLDSAPYGYWHGIDHCGYYIRDLAELDAYGAEYGITFQPYVYGAENKDDAQYGYVVEFMGSSSPDNTYANTLRISPLAAWMYYDNISKGETCTVFAGRCCANWLTSTKRQAEQTMTEHMFNYVNWHSGKTHVSSMVADLVKSHLKVKSVGCTGIALSASSDVDALDNGVYRTHSASVMASLAERHGDPFHTSDASGGFTLIQTGGGGTTGHAYAMQIMMENTLNDEPPRIYARRAGASGAWKAWSEFGGVVTPCDPVLTERQKAEIKALADAYYNNRTTTFYYDYNVTHNGYANNRCYNADEGKFRLCCATFVEMLWLGRDISDFLGKDSATYSNSITKAFDWGYSFNWKDRKKIGGAVQRDDNGAIDGYYKYIQPNKSTDQKDYTWSHSVSTLYNANKTDLTKYPNMQQFKSFLMANDMAKELYEMGCEIPFSDLDVGDLIFIGKERNSSVEDYLFVNNTRFRGITHVAMIINKAYDGALSIIDCTSDSDTLPILKSGENFAGIWDKTRAFNMIDNVVMCARHPAAFGKSNVLDCIDYIPMAYPDGIDIGRGIPVNVAEDGSMVDTDITEGLYYVYDNEIGVALTTGTVSVWDNTNFDIKYK